MKKIVILGATGSIGKNALSVIDNLNRIRPSKYAFQLKAIVSNSNWQATLKQIIGLKPQFAVVNDPDAYAKLSNILKRKKMGRTKLLCGQGAVKKLVTAPDVDIVLSSISGADGLYPTLWAISANKRVALANKESLVIAGELLRTLKGFGKVIPVDSEHSGLFQILHKSITCAGDISHIRRIILTASGGPFYNLRSDRLARVTPASALNHPTYRMGKKITVDSATLMNKAFEIIEAYYLFNIPPEKIEVVIHPQSVVHAMVEFADGSIIAQMNQPDMKLPIQYALTHPDRIPSPVKQIDFTKKAMSLTFLKPDTRKFPALLLGYEVIRRGGTAGAVLNAANESAVKLFLQGNIPFTNITKLVTRVLNAHKPLGLTLDNITQADQWARRQVNKLLED